MEPLIIGKSAAIKNLLSFIEKAAKSDSNVIVLGETGVGKELVAKAIHKASNRKDRPFLKINCGNLNENLVESELFGYRKGAFTGAFIDKCGLIEAANEGTFFFDEIGDISPYLQSKLLSVVEDKEIRRIGENIFRKINVRFIFATNKDLHSQVLKGKFRQDLFYRIAILTFYISPLRERKKDIPLLVEEIFKRENLNKSKNISITKNGVDKLIAHSYPGNVRELENILKRACEFSKADTVKENDIIFQIMPKTDERRKTGKFKMNQIVDALIENKGNKTKTAKKLGISRVHLYRLLDLEKYNTLNRRGPIC